jgi:hypothetical protein
MKEYRIKMQMKKGEDYATMIISHRNTGDHIAEYRLTSGQERKEMAQMRRSIDRHLSKPGATLGNYQW